jgi:hypothetical protein
MSFAPWRRELSCMGCECQRLETPLRSRPHASAANNAKRKAARSAKAQSGAQRQSARSNKKRRTSRGSGSHHTSRIIEGRLWRDLFSRELRFFVRAICDNPLIERYRLLSGQHPHPKGVVRQWPGGGVAPSVEPSENTSAETSSDSSGRGLTSSAALRADDLPPGQVLNVT